MRNRKVVLLSLIIASMILSMPQLGHARSISPMQNDQGLWWGLEEGNTIGYSYHFDYPDITPVSFHFYVTIDSLPVIQDGISETHQVVLNENFFTMRFDNGTELEPSVSYPITAIPVGNWTLLQQIVDPMFFGIGHHLSQTEWIDTFDEWGFKLIHIWNVYYRTEVVFRFSKFDGGLNVFRGETVDEDLEVQYLDITRDGLQFPGTILIIIGGGLIAAVIVLSIVISRRRR
jgi:hypothetical protein